MNGYMNGPTSLTNGGGHGMAGNSSGPASMPPAVNGLTNGDTEDKWYMKDSMRPIGATTHGVNCKCYRCQRKLTAI